VGADEADIDGLLAELRDADVFTQKPDGTIVSRRMIRDYTRSNTARRNGSKGGNPHLVKQEVNQDLQTLVNQTDSPNSATMVVAPLDIGVNLKCEMGVNQTEKTLEESKDLFGTGSRKTAKVHIDTSFKKDLDLCAIAKKTETKNRGTRLSADWRLPSDWKHDAISKGMRAGDVDIEEQRFRNYWIAKAGAGAVKVDWHATWRNWILNNLNRNGTGFQNGKPNGYVAPPIKKDPRQFTDDEWLPKLKFYKNTRNWNPDWGPELGARGCLAPERLTAGGKFEPY
jgi:hypothetical protein